MKPLDKDRGIVGRESLNKLLVVTRFHYIGFARKGTYQPCIAFVIVNLAAIFLQFLLLLTTILESMQVYVNAKTMQRPDAMKDINNTPIVSRVRNIERNYMKHDGVGV